MRIWDVPAGYLSRQSLLGEHRELHGLHSILVNGKTGYSRHPETLRWVGCATALIRRHDLLAAEMRLRGYIDRTPLASARGRRPRWPSVFVASPGEQYALLQFKYGPDVSGRIPLPHTTQELWAQHKYSVMARDPARCAELGRETARLRARARFAELAEELTVLLREPPRGGRLTTAVEHMWGYVSRSADPAERMAAERSLGALLQLTQRLAIRQADRYLLASTALSELSVYA